MGEHVHFLIGKDVAAKVKLDFNKSQPCTSKETNQTSDSIEIITDCESSSNDLDQKSTLKGMNDSDLQLTKTIGNGKSDVGRVLHKDKTRLIIDETTKQKDYVPVVEVNDSDDKDLEQMIEDAFQIYSKDDSCLSGGDEDEDEDNKSEKSVSDIDGIDSETEVVDNKVNDIIIISDEEIESLETLCKQTPLKEHKKMINQPKPSPTQSVKSLSLSQGSLDGYFKCASPISPLISSTPKKDLNETTPIKKNLLTSNKKSPKSRLSSSKKGARLPQQNMTSNDHKIIPLKRKASAGIQTIQIKKSLDDTTKCTSSWTDSNVISSGELQSHSSKTSSDDNQNFENVSSHPLKTVDTNKEEDIDMGKNSLEETGNNCTRKVSKSVTKINAFTLMMSKQDNKTGKKLSVGIKGSNRPVSQNAMVMLMNARNQNVKGQLSKAIVVTSDHQIPRIPTPDQATGSYTGGYYGNRANRPCPFYKKMPGKKK